MLRPKIVKLINDELNIKNEQPFIIEGENSPYRMKKDGSIERFTGQTWGASSYSLYDIVSLVDAKRISIYKDTPLVEYKPVGKK